MNPSFIFKSADLKLLVFLPIGSSVLMLQATVEEPRSAAFMRSHKYTETCYKTLCTLCFIQHSLVS